MKTDLDYILEILATESAEQTVTMHDLWDIVNRAKLLKQADNGG